MKSAALAIVLCVLRSTLLLAQGSQSSDRPPSLASVEGAYSAPRGEGASLIGTKPREWKVTNWINSKPLSLGGLAGKVVLVRWWTAPGCPFCRASAPALNELWSRYRGQGLVTIGFYHEKSKEPLSPAEVKAQAEQLGFTFPVAIDPEWKTLRNWWLDGNEHGWTSVTFLLDRAGVIRHIHPGGAFFKGDPGYEALENVIKKLLAEPLLYPVPPKREKISSERQRI